MLAVLIAALGSTLGTIANVPQIIRVIKLQCAAAISYYSLLLRMSASLCFLIAIMLTGSYLVALTNMFMLFGSSFLLYLKSYYANKKIRNQHGCEKTSDTCNTKAIYQGRVPNS